MFPANQTYANQPVVMQPQPTQVSPRAPLPAAAAGQPQSSPVSAPRHEVVAGGNLPPATPPASRAHCYAIQVLLLY